MEENKKRNILLIVAVVTILLLVVGATYAYFQAQIGDGANSNVNVLTGTTDSLVFSTDDAILIEADIDNFGKDAEDKFLEGSTIARATLRLIIQPILRIYTDIIST